MVAWAGSYLIINHQWADRISRFKVSAVIEAQDKVYGMEGRAAAWERASVWI